MEPQQNLIIPKSASDSIDIIDGNQEELGAIPCKLRTYAYSIDKLEALRYVDLNEQKRRWREMHQSLESYVAKEYDGLLASNQQQSKKKKKQQQQKKKDAVFDIMSEVSSIETIMCPDVLNLSGFACGDTLTCNENSKDIEEPLEEYDDIRVKDGSSSDEYDSIQKLAFFVEGEPDFESGPPLDGLEYLRRVRWEAAQIPKVRVVKLNSDKLSNEQTPYMPSIPEIPKCSPNLMSSEDWENAFLADFSELRQAISVLVNSCTEQSLTTTSKTPGKQSICIQDLKKNTPTLTTILGMDPVSRAATLRNSISLFESATILWRDDCLWLFALCVAVDTPLHADTCASMRCLLRKCYGFLALKSEIDDEVAMLSILVAIAGKYFGQLENL